MDLPIPTCFAISSLTRIAPIGNPFANGFAIVTISGLVVSTYKEGVERGSRIRKSIGGHDVCMMTVLIFWTTVEGRKKAMARDSLSFSREIAVRPHRPRPIKTAL
jgi:hypothetical protein